MSSQTRALLVRSLFTSISQQIMIHFKSSKIPVSRKSKEEHFSDCRGSLNMLRRRDQEGDLIFTKRDIHCKMKKSTAKINWFLSCYINVTFYPQRDRDSLMSHDSGVWNHFSQLPITHPSLESLTLV